MCIKCPCLSSAIVSKMFYVLLLTLVSIVTADYGCVCNYNNNYPVQDRPDQNGQTLGYMLQFDCAEQLLSSSTSNYVAIALPQKIGYLRTNHKIESRLCSGNPKPLTLLPATTTSPKPTTNQPSTTTRSSTASTTTSPSTTRATMTTSKPVTPSPTSTHHTCGHCPNFNPVIQGHTSLCPSQLVYIAQRLRYNIAQYGQSCYMFRTGISGWVSCESFCKDYGGHLLVISSQDEQNFIMSFLRKLHIQNPVWLGLNDRSHEEHFQWQTGQRLTYTNWYPNRKNATLDEDCVALIPKAPYNGQWDDLECGYNITMHSQYKAQHSICEAPISSSYILGVIG